MENSDDIYELERVCRTYDFISKYQKGFYLTSKKSFKHDDGIHGYTEYDFKFIGQSIHEAKINLALLGFTIGKLNYIGRELNTQLMTRYKFTLSVKS